MALGPHPHLLFLPACSSVPNPNPRECIKMILGAQQSHVASSLQRHLSGHCKLLGLKYVIFQTHTQLSTKRITMNEISFTFLHTQVCPNVVNCVLPFHPYLPLWLLFVHSFIHWVNIENTLCVTHGAQHRGCKSAHLHRADALSHV